MAVLSLSQSGVPSIWAATLAIIVSVGVVGMFTGMAGLLKRISFSAYAGISKMRP